MSINPPQTLAWDATRFSLDASDYSSGLFLATVASRGYTHMRTRALPIGEAKADDHLAMVGEVSFASRGEGRTKVLMDRPAGLLSMDLRHNFLRVTAAGNDPDALEGAIEDLIAKLPKPESPEERTPVAFWSELKGMGNIAVRGLEPEPWQSLADSYPSAVRSGLDELMSLRAAPEGGRLILWHGEPGTGKTHALRALAHEWRGWCSMHFITDPDRFIGMGMSYMLSVLNAEVHGTASSHQKLLVLEDAGELLSTDARQQSGHGLSRLLNLSDGLLGIGMDAITLISTNEPLGKLHPAVHRPGRCIAEVEFTALDVDEATEWLARRGSEAIVDGPKTLAQLYAILQGRDQGARRT